MTIHFQLPRELALNLEARLGDLDVVSKEALLVQAFRVGLLTHYELSQAVQLDRSETDALLQRHGVTEGTSTFEELDDEQRTLDRILGTAGS